MTYDELMQSILTAQEEMLKHKIEANSVTLNGKKYGKMIEDCPPNMKPTIFGMAVKADYTMPDDYDFLVQYEPPHPQTNADRIRAMTDEELAEWIAYEIWKAFAQGAGNPFFNQEEAVKLEKQEWLDWLLKEVK